MLTAGTSTPVAILIVFIGLILGGVTLWRAGRTRVRTVYRPDTWALPEWLVSIAGVAVLGIFLAARISPDQALILRPELDTWPSLPLWGLLAFGIACTPAISAPPPPAFDIDTNEPVGAEALT